MDLLEEKHAQGPRLSPQHPAREETEVLDFVRLVLNKAKYRNQSIWVLCTEYVFAMVSVL